MMKTLISKPAEEELKISIRQFCEDRKNFLLDGERVIVDCLRMQESDYKLMDYLTEEPLNFMRLFEEAISILCENPKVVFINLKNTKVIHRIRTEDIGHFFTFRGMVKRVTKILPRTIAIIHECPACGTEIETPQERKKIKLPSKCSCGHKGTFNEKRKKTVDIQEINLEETQEDAGERQPQQIRVYLQEPLTDFSMTKRLQPGKRVEVLGTVNYLPAFMTVTDETLNLSEFMINASNIISLEQDEEINLSEDDIKDIEEIAAHNPLSRMAGSLAPEVYGNEMIKKALILQQLKGVKKLKSDGTYTRADIHILLCGDPGISKSVSLNAIKQKTPRCGLVVGNRTSKVGIGGMVVKDELTNTWALEAGALVLNSGGTLCIDEFDKMPKEHLAELLEPMSSATSTIAKANINSTMPAETNILAAANPKEGTFFPDKPIAAQLDLPAPNVNRFDLIFIMLDKPNKEYDENSITHVFQNMTEKRTPEIDNQLFKKYIYYCRKLTPKLKPELLNLFKDFYVNLRQRSESKETGEKGLPINLRNIEGLIRLSEAHAKLRLSKFVEEQDVKVAKEIFMFCLKQVGIDSETGLIDQSRITKKIPDSKRGKLMELLTMLDGLSQRIGNLIPYQEIAIEAEKKEIKKMELNDFLEELKRTGQIYEPRGGYFSVL